MSARAPFAFSRVEPPWWDARPVFIVGGGPSVIGCKLDTLRSRGWVLGVNRVAELIRCDATFTMDRELHIQRSLWIEALAREQEVYAAFEAGHEELGRCRGVRYLELCVRNPVGVSLDPSRIVNGCNSGYGALNLAILKRAREVYLLGFDMVKMRSEEPSHWHGGYPWTNRTSLVYYQRWADRFASVPATLPPGVKVWNCNPGSAIRAFPFKSYEEMGLR